MFTSDCERRYIQTVVNVLITHVKKPEKYSRGKIKCVLNYLKGTWGINLTLSIEDMPIVKCWVETSYEVHEDSNGNMGAVISLYKGAMINQYTMKNIIDRGWSNWCGLRHIWQLTILYYHNVFVNQP